MVLNADTDGDLRAVTDASRDARGTPAGAAGEGDSHLADFDGVSSRELGITARRLIDVLAHRTDETAHAELQRLSESLAAALTDQTHSTQVPDQPHTDSGPIGPDQTDPGREPVWDRWFR